MDLADFLGIDRAAVEQGTENNRCAVDWKNGRKKFQMFSFPRDPITF